MGFFMRALYGSIAAELSWIRRCTKQFGRRLPVMKNVLRLVLALVLVSSGHQVFAQGRGHGPKHQGKKDNVAREGDVVAIDRDGHRRVIVDYYRQGLPPGLAKRDDLPPGLRRQLHERGTLPPGLQKRLIVVPAPLDRRLPRIPVQSRRYFVGDDLIVIDPQRNVILGIIPDVLPRR
jgi:hypothetical protein